MILQRIQVCRRRLHRQAAQTLLATPKNDNNTSSTANVVDTPVNWAQFAAGAITAEIVGTKLRESPPPPVTLFIIKVSSGAQHYHIERRYSQFLLLYNDLSIFFERAFAHEFPEKTILESPRDEKIVAARRTGLQKFLQTNKAGSPEQKGAYLASYGAVVQYGYVPRPILFPANEPILVQIAVRASTVSAFDARVRRGDLRTVLPFHVPMSIAHDFSGTVLAVGAGVRQYRVGDDVFGRLDDRQTGAMATTVLVAAPLLAHKPPAISHTEAASIPTMALTAHQGLVEQAKVIAGTKLLVSDCATPLGAFALQYAAKALGAVCTARCANKAANVERLTQMGATTIIDAKDSKQLSALKASFDVVFDTDDSAELIFSVRAGGVYVSASGMPMPDALERHSQLGLPRALRWLFGPTQALAVAQARVLKVQYRSVLPRSSGDVMRAVAQLLADGTLKASVDRVYRLPQIAEAIAFFDKRGVAGAIGVDVDDDDGDDSGRVLGTGSDTSTHTTPATTAAASTVTPAAAAAAAASSPTTATAVTTTGLATLPATDNNDDDDDDEEVDADDDNDGGVPAK